ncbi:MAG: molybdopterin molybdotransferase MoeA [Sarcina sp.]
MISLEEAKHLILSATKVKDIEEVSILEANGRVLAEDILAPLDSPPFNRSPLDGYAVRAVDLQGASKENPITFKVIDKIYAGYCSKKEIKEFEAIRIMTGTKIPEGADTIVRQEDTEVLEDNLVNIFVSQKSYDNFIFKGEDFKKDTEILKKGIILKPKDVMAIASLGLAKIKVFKKVVVSVLTTGDELQSPGEKLEEGKIYNSNKVFLKLRLEELGCIVKLFDSVNDDEESIAKLIKEAEPISDILLSTGGVSVGERDIVKEVAQGVGYSLLFWKVDVKPGSPMFAAVNRENKIYIGLSGTPVAAATTFELTVRDLLGKMLCCEELNLKEEEAILQDEFRKISNKRRFLRVFLEHGAESKVYIKKAYQSPGQINTMLNSNAILEIPKNTEFKINSKVKIYR